MTRSALLALIAVGLISACSSETAQKFGAPPLQPSMVEGYSDSIGFTGIGYEPHPKLLK